MAGKELVQLVARISKVDEWLRFRWNLTKAAEESGVRVDGGPGPSQNPIAGSNGVRSGEKFVYGVDKFTLQTEGQWLRFEFTEGGGVKMYLGDHVVGAGLEHAVGDLVKKYVPTAVRDLLQM